MNDLKTKGLVDWNSVPGSLMRTDGKLTDQQFIAKILTLSRIPEVKEAIDEFYLVTPEKNPSKPAPKTTKKRATKATASLKLCDKVLNVLRQQNPSVTA